MAFQTYRLSVVGDILGQEMVNVFHWAKPDGSPDDIPEDLTGAWLFYIHALYVDCLPTAYLTRSITARLVGGTVQHEESDSTAGTRTGDILAPQLSPTVTWSTRFATRSARGRTYLPGITESDGANGETTTSLQDAMDLWARAMIGDLNGAQATWTFSVHSYVHGTTRDVTGYRVNRVIRTQRRRTLGVGV